MKLKKWLVVALAGFGLAAAAPAFAQEKLTVWWVKGFYPAEDAALFAAIKKYEEKHKGVKIELSQYPVQDMRSAVEEGGDYVAHDLAFHQGLLRASRNRMVIQMSKALGALLRTSFEISTARKDGPRNSLPLHRDVLDAIIARDPIRAEKSSLLLIDGARNDIESVLAGRKRLPRLDMPAAPLRVGG